MIITVQSLNEVSPPGSTILFAYFPAVRVPRTHPASRPSQIRKGCHMPNKVLRCGDVMPGCDTVIEGKTEDEVFAKAEAHARKEHNMTIILPSTMREIGAAIHDKT